jgi:predicted ester cyclase
VVAVPDLTFEWLGEPFISVDGSRMAAAWKGVGHMTGRLEPPGFAPTGGRVEVTGIDIHEFDGELVRRVVTATDTIAMGRQIGAAPAAGSRGELVGELMQRLTARRLRTRAR